MKKAEYTARFEELQKAHIKACNKLDVEFVTANNPYKKGMIIEDHYHRILIEKITYARSNVYKHNFPECVYRGKRLTKENAISKRQTDTFIYQSNVERVIEEEVQPYRIKGKHK